MSPWVCKVKIQTEDIAADRDACLTRHVRELIAKTIKLTIGMPIDRLSRRTANPQMVACSTIASRERSMATKTITTYTDDIDGSDDNVETVKFGLWGATYEIDLSKDNQSKLEKALEPYLEVARKASGGTSVRRGSGKATTSASAYDAKAVRAWATANDVTVPARGRIPGAVVEQYQAAGN